jgi:hypothetical protein
LATIKLKQRHRKGDGQEQIWNRSIEKDCGKNRIEIKAHGQFFKIMFQNSKGGI